MGQYFALAGLVFGVNLLPALSPPTWAILVFYKLDSSVNTGAIIAIGVLAASSGRFILAHGFRLIRFRLKGKNVENLELLRNYLTRGGRSWILYFLFFVLSPLPSAQIFEAAGLMNLKLISISMAFALGRSISYS